MDNLNVNMKPVSTPPAIVLTPPDALHKPVIYSDREASWMLNALKADIFQKSKDAVAADKI